MGKVDQYYFSVAFIMLGFSGSQWLLIFAVLLYLIYRWSTATFGFFSEKGIPFVKPYPFLGNFGSVLLRKQTFHEILLDIYSEFENEKYV